MVLNQRNERLKTRYKEIDTERQGKAVIKEIDFKAQNLCHPDDCFHRNGTVVAPSSANLKVVVRVLAMSNHLCRVR